MKVAVAQIQSVTGDIETNIGKHLHFIKAAASHEADALFFPELSLTGYEPRLAKNTATTPHDKRLSVLQSASNETNTIIGAGLPTNYQSGICISMIVFSPQKTIQVYAKQHLHADELPFFISGKKQLYLPVKNKLLAPAICYESLLMHHAEQVTNEGANVYVASVAKSALGVIKANGHYPIIAKKYAMPVLMANSVSYCDNFECAGNSGIWNEDGKRLANLAEKEEGLLIFDTASNAVATMVLA